MSALSDVAETAVSGGPRLAELEAKRLRYEALSRKLFTLPQKLQHAGLIPVGPRLFLPGALVNTNRLTVLLGSCDEEAYFAERSAFQAQGIVQRRLAVIEEKVKDVVVGKEEVDNALRGEEEGGPKDEALLLPGATVDVENGSVKKLRRRVSFRDPVVTEVHVSENYKKKRKGKKAASASASAAAAKEQASGKPNTKPNTVNGKQQYPANNQKEASAKETPDSKIVSATAEPVGDANKSPATENAEPILRSKKEATPTPAPQGSSGTTLPKDASSSPLQQERHAVRSEFDKAIRTAEQRVLQGGIVNLTEVYDADGESEGPSRVELPMGFVPDAGVSFGEESAEFLDVTGGAEKEREEDKEDGNEASREDFFEALLAAEREGEAEENEKKKGKRVQEEREFGKGFSRGFFGAPAVKAPTPSTRAVKAAAPATAAPVKATAPRITDKEVELVDEEQTEPGTEVLNLVDEVSEGPGEGRLDQGTAVRERVVERRPGRKGGRRGRKMRASSILEMRGSGMPVPESRVEAAEEDEEKEAQQAEEGVSRFRQMRNRQREHL